MSAVTAILIMGTLIVAPHLSRCIAIPLGVSLILWAAIGCIVALFDGVPA